MRAAFISDVHLTALDDPRAVLFLRWLKSLSAEDAVEPKITHLFLLGDIFDLWVADHAYFVKKFQSIVDELEKLRKSGVKIHYFEGNHDLDLRPFWEKKMDFVVHEGPLLAQLGTWKLRIEHGDQMDPEDKGYIFLRWLLRTPVMRFIGRHFPGFLVRRLGEWMSKKSRHYTSEIKVVSPMGARDKIRTHAELMANKEYFDLLISGHLHVEDDFIWPREAIAGIKEKPDAYRKEVRSINLGTWLVQPKVLWLLDDKILVENL